MLTLYNNSHTLLCAGTVVCWPTSMGWMMGPWLLFATLLNGGTIALYQGSPLGRDFGQFVAAAGVQVLGLVPSIVKAWRASDCMRGLDWSRLRCFSSTGGKGGEGGWVGGQGGIGGGPQVELTC